MGIIDTHVHLYPPALNEAPSLWAARCGEDAWSVLCTRVRKNGRGVQAFPTVDGLLRAMDSAGVEKAVLQGWYWQNHDTCVLQNRFYAECIRDHPDRLAAFATLHPRIGLDGVVAEINWASEIGFKGLGELSPHAQGVALDDPAWIAALQKAGEVGLAVTLHVTEPRGKDYPGRVSTPLGDFVCLARSFPGTTFLLAHWGAQLPFDPVHAGTVRQLTNVYYDTAASPLLYDATIWRRMIDAAGAERLLFGSDFPLILYPRFETEPSMASLVRELRSAAVGAKAEEAILRGNAARVLGV